MIKKLLENELDSIPLIKNLHEVQKRKGDVSALMQDKTLLAMECVKLRQIIADHAGYCRHFNEVLKKSLKNDPEQV